MPSVKSSNINVAIRTRRSNLQHRHRNDLFYVLNHPTFTNVFHYMKYFFLKSSLGRLTLVFMLLGIFHMFVFSRFHWPKFLQWLNNNSLSK